MDNMESTFRDDALMSLNNETKNYLLEISKWGKLLAIVGYVGMGFLILVGLAVIIGFSFFNSFSDADFPFGSVGIIYILLAVLNYFPVNYLYKFSGQIKQGLNTNDQKYITSGFGNLKSLFKFMGIFTIVILSIYALALIVVLPLTLFLLK